MSVMAARKHITPADIAAARTAAGLTQRAAAECVCTTQATWSNWESGKARMHPAFFALFLLFTGQHPTRQLVPKPDQPQE